MHRVASGTTEGKVGMGFTVALNRDRDSYQVPLALAEAGELDCFVTDYYVGTTPLPVPTLSHRQVDGIPAELVRSSLPASLRQLPFEVARRRWPVDFPSRQVEDALGRTVARQARRRPDSDLLLYSGSARRAFAGPSTGRRVLFQYHPSPDFIERTMLGIDEMGDARAWTAEAELLDPKIAEVHAEEVRLADRAICASSFTRKGLVEDGMAPTLVDVVPYGCPPVGTLPEQTESETCHFLFVGQGVQRKGLHLLVEAWRQARPSRSELTVVASRLDPEIARFAEGVPGLTVLPRQPRAELDRLMASCDTFVLPSLVEGFGLVLGEALAHGSRIIASEHTGAVDMGLPDSVGRIVGPGRVQPIADALLWAADTYRPSRPYRSEALATAERVSWSSFRRGIREAVGIPETHVRGAS